jgi:hypothetical protein
MLCYRLFLQLYLFTPPGTMTTIVGDYERRNRVTNILEMIERRMMGLCTKFGIDEKYVLIREGIRSRFEQRDLRVKIGSQTKRFVFNDKFRPYASLIETLFMAVYSFVASLDSEAIHLFEYKSSTGAYVKLSTSEERLAFVMKTTLAPVIICSNLPTSRDYINALISFFTTISIDTVYGSSAALIFPSDIYHDPLLHKYAKFSYEDSVDYLKGEVRTSRRSVGESLMTCLRVSEPQGKTTTKTFAFVNGFQFVEYTTKVLVYNIAEKNRYVPKSRDMNRLIKISNRIIKKCRSGFEGSIIAYVVFEYIYENSDALSKVRGWIDMLFTEVRTKYSVDYLNGWMNFQHTHLTDDAYRLKYTTTFISPMKTTLRMCLNYSTSNVRMISPASSSKSNVMRDTVTITANQLIDYIFSSESIGNPMDTSTLPKLYETLKIVSKHTTYTTRPNRFQMVQIAANEGTSKPFVESVVTELVQNSFDALRTSHLAISQPAIRIGVTESLISVGDPVGIPPHAYLSLWIPFLSSKSGSVVVTGEMGTGFYNLYRYPWCKNVIIESNDVEIIAIPILHTLPNNKKRVVDIEYVVSIPRAESSSKGTTITVNLSDGLKSEERISLAMEGYVFVNSQMSLMNSDVKITYGGNVVNNLDVNLVFGSQIGMCRVYTNSSYPSLLFTNGIPMGRLVPFLESVFGKVDNSDVETGIVVDLNKSYYTSTQSRNRLVVNSEGKHNEELKTFLTKSVYNALLQKLGTATFDDNRTDIYESYFPNASSKASITQFLGYNGSLKNVVGDTKFFVYKGISTASSIQMSMKTYFSAIDIALDWAINGKVHPKISSRMKHELSTIRFTKIKNGGVRISQDHIAAITEVLLPSSAAATPRQRYPINLVGKWFVGKVYGEVIQKNVFVVQSSNSSSSSSSSSAIGAIQLTDGDKRNMEVFVNMLNVVCKAYYEIGRTLNTKGLNFTAAPPKIEITPDSADFTAQYDIGAHTIRVSYVKIHNQLKDYTSSWLLFRNLVTSGKKIEAIEYARTKAKFWDFVGRKIPASTLIHEIQHALFGTNHTGTYAHGEHTYTLNGKRVTTPFEVTCERVYDAVASNGLWNHIIKLI